MNYIAGINYHASLWNTIDLNRIEKTAKAFGYIPRCYSDGKQRQIIIDVGDNIRKGKRITECIAKAANMPNNPQKYDGHLKSRSRCPWSY